MILLWLTYNNFWFFFRLTTNFSTRTGITTWSRLETKIYVITIFWHFWFFARLQLNRRINLGRYYHVNMYKKYVNLHLDQRIYVLWYLHILEALVHNRSLQLLDILEWYQVTLVLEPMQHNHLGYIRSLHCYTSVKIITR